MYLQPQTFNTRLLEHSTLSPGARLVALAISLHRFKRRLKPHEPLPLTVAVLARDCGMSPRSVRTYVAECVAAGWVEARAVRRGDGRQQANEYLLAEPDGATPPARRRHTLTEADRQRLTESRTTGGKPLPPVTAPLAPVAGGNGSPKSGRGLQGVVRSNYYVEDGAPPGAAGLHAQENPQQQPQPEPAAAPQPLEGGSEPAPDTARWIALVRARANQAQTEATVRATEPDAQAAADDGLDTATRALIRARTERQADSPMRHRCPKCFAAVGRQCHTPLGTSCWERRELARQQLVTA
jgi:hypothetical protein